MRDFGQTLFLPDESDQRARQIIDRDVFATLKEAKLGYTVNRTVIYGSAGKNTGLWVKVDYDSVVFGNLRNFPRTVKEVDSLSDEILTAWGALFPNLNIIRLPRGLKFSLRAIDIDLMLGFDTSWEPQYCGSSIYQVERVMDIVRDIRPVKVRIEFARKVSTLLCKLGVDFMKQQSSVVHELARVAKFWVFFSCLTNKWAAEKSTIIELVCVEAAQSAQNKYDILDSFLNFLELVINHRYWKIGADRLQGLSVEEKRYMSKVPFIIDPSNPYNNMYNGPRVESLLLELQNPAYETRKKIISCTLVFGRSIGYGTLSPQKIKTGSLY